MKGEQGLGILLMAVSEANRKLPYNFKRSLLRYSVFFDCNPKNFHCRQNGKVTEY